MKKFLVSLFALLCLIPSVSMAVSIDYSLTSLGGNSYRYDYRVTNDGSLGAGVDVKLFDISFDTSLYNEVSLMPVSGTAITDNWSEMIFASAPGIPALYDVYALGNGIGVGSTVSGFSVQFDWLGAASGPGAQDFLVYDADSFAQLETGLTSQYVPPVDPGTAPVPEPSTMILTALGLAGVGFVRKRMKK